jgi:lysophospholipase L1-like esterase
MQKKMKFLVIVMMVLAFAGCSTDKKKEDVMVKVAIIGDSISDGCNPELSTSVDGYAKRYGYAQMLEGISYEGIERPAKTIYNIWENTEFKNFSITGSEAAEWNNDSSNSTKWHTWDKEFAKVLDFNPDVAVIYIGANDILGYIYNDGVITTAEWNELKANLKGIVDQLQAKNKDIKIVMVGYYDMFDGYSKVAAAASPNFGAFGDMSTIVLEGNKIIKDVATEEEATYVETYSTFMNHGYGAFLGNQTPLQPFYFTNNITTFDIHPVTAGHKAIYEKVYSALESIK